MEFFVAKTFPLFHRTLEPKFTLRYLSNGVRIMTIRIYVKKLCVLHVDLLNLPPWYQNMPLLIK